MKSTVSITAFLALLCTNTVATEFSPEEVSDISDEQLIRRDASHRLASIRSKEQLDRHVSSQRNDSPLLALSPGGKSRFLNSLVFTERGLASFDYSDLRSELSASQAYRFLSLFSVEHAVSSIPGLRVQDETDSLLIHTDAFKMPEVDYDRHACTAPATCSFNSNSICIGDNC